MIQFEVNVYYVITGIIGFVAWLIRLEAKVLYLDKDFSNHKKEAVKKDELHEQKDAKIWEKFDNVYNQLNEITKSLSRIEGKLENK